MNAMAAILPLRKPDHRTETSNLQLEIAALHAERAADAEYIGPRMAFLLPYLVECGPSAHQVGLGILHRVGRMAARTPDGDAA